MSKFKLCRSCLTHHGSWRLPKAHHFQTASSGFPRRAAAAWYVYWTNDVDLLKDDNLAQMLSNLCKWETWMQEWRVDKEFRPTQMHPSIPRIPFLCQHRGICETSLYQQLLCAKHVGLHVILRPYCSWAKDLNWSKCFSEILAHWAWWLENDKTNICESGLLIVFNGSHTLQENQLCFISSASEFWRPGSAEPLGVQVTKCYLKWNPSRLEKRTVQEIRIHLAPWSRWFGMDFNGFQWINQSANFSTLATKVHNIS